MGPESIIKAFLKRKKEAHPAYSLRAFARDLKTSASYLSEVLSGKKKLPPKWIEPVTQILGLDEVAQADLKSLTLRSHLKGSGLENLFDSISLTTPSRAGLARPLGREKISVLTKWYYVAVLDFLTLDHGPFNEFIIAERLDLSVAAIRESLAVLKDLGLIIVDTKGYATKTDTHLRFPTSKTDPRIRNFHTQMIDKAKFELLRNTKESDFSRRLITCSTMAVDPKQTQKVKARIQAFMAEISQEFSTGSARELYQFNLQLFPLTKKS